MACLPPREGGMGRRALVACRALVTPLPVRPRRARHGDASHRVPSRTPAAGRLCLPHKGGGGGSGRRGLRQLQPRPMSRAAALVETRPDGAFAGRLQRFEPSMLLWLALVAVLVFLVASPMVRLLVSSFQEADTGRLTLSNYLAAYGRPRHLQALWNSLQLGTGVAGVARRFTA